MSILNNSGTPLCSCEWNISNAVTTETSQHIYPTGAFLWPKKYHTCSLTSCSARLHFDICIRNYSSSYFNLCQVLLMHFVFQGLALISHWDTSCITESFCHLFGWVWTTESWQNCFLHPVNFKQPHNLGFTEAN